MPRYTLNLTDEQSETLGFALTAALRSVRNQAELDKVALRNPGRLSDPQSVRDRLDANRDRAERIEELRFMLDVAPAGDNSHA
jgi:hypothetical protein